MDASKVKKPGIFDAIRAEIGVHETLFLIGIAALFWGIWGLWSLHGALAVCGAVLIGVAIFSIVIAKRQGGN